MKRLNVEEIKQFADALGFTESEYGSQSAKRMGRTYCLKTEI